MVAEHTHVGLAEPAVRTQVVGLPARGHAGTSTCSKPILYVFNDDPPCRLVLVLARFYRRRAAIHHRSSATAAARRCSSCAVCAARYSNGAGRSVGIARTAAPCTDRRPRRPQPFRTSAPIGGDPTPLAVAAMLATALPCAAPPRTQRPAKPAEHNEEGIDAERLFGAIVKVSTQAVPDARSSATLGSEREGTGVVIGDNGLILTIGYLIVEAEDVSDRRQQGTHARRAGRRLRPCHRLRPPAHDRAARREAGRARRLARRSPSATR